jgi:hypothetical protein
MWIVTVPNGCAKGSLSSALNCMSSPILTNVGTLVTRTNNYASSGKIDATSNMANDKVYIFHGTSDSVVSHGTRLLLCYQNSGKFEILLIVFLTSQCCLLI